MPKYVAFLRAINVGGHTVKMQDLKRLIESQNFSNVETFIASGNVVFDSPGKAVKNIETRIERCLQTALGYAVSTFVRLIPAVMEIANRNPFKETSNGQIYIGFLKAQADDSKIDSLISDVDDLKLLGSEIYWHCRTSFSESKISGALLEKTLGMPMTLRNVTTVRKIAEKYVKP